MSFAKWKKTWKRKKSHLAELREKFGCEIFDWCWIDILEFTFYSQSTSNEIAFTSNANGDYSQATHLVKCRLSSNSTRKSL